MAGIGFELRKILSRDTIGAWAHAYLFGALVVLGPFLCSVLSLGAISLLTRALVEPEARRIFTGATVTVFGSSLVMTGVVQVVLTRYLADLVYRGEHERLVGCLFPSLLLSSGCLTLTALPLFVVSPLPLLERVILWSLLMTVGALWILVVFVTTSEGHKAVVASFIAGSTIACLAAWLLSRRFGLAGLLGGYTLGQFAILCALTRHLLRELGDGDRWDWGLLAYFRHFPSLIAIGVLTNLGAWIDKFVFWFSALQQPAGGFYTAPKYDSATFLGFLTCLPAMTHFFVRIEADFSQHFHDYFDQIFFRSSYDKIVAAAGELRRGVIAALLDIFKIQGVISFLAAVFAVPLLQAVGLPVSEVGMFRFAITGSLFLSFMLFSNVILLYLDRRREVLIVGVIFTGSNLALSLGSLRAGYAWYGAGFATACLLGVSASLFFLTDQLFNLEYRTFSSIPVIGRKKGTGIRWHHLALLLALLPSLAQAQQPQERSWSIEARTGAGVDSNALHDPGATRKTALLRFDLDAEVVPARELRLGLVGWLDEHMPLYDHNEASGQLMLLSLIPAGQRLFVKIGSFNEYHREVSTYFEGTVYTHGGALQSDVGKHLALGLVFRLGIVDIDLGAQGHARWVDGPRPDGGNQNFKVLGADGNFAVRVTPNRFFSMRLRYLFLWQDVTGLTLVNPDGAVLSGLQRDLQVYTHQADVALHVRPIAPLDLLLRYEFAAVDDDYLGYLYGREHRLLAELRYETERHWAVDISGKLIHRSYPRRNPSVDNQDTDLPFEIIADVSYYIHRNVGLFVRYQFDGESANPFGLIYTRHAAIAGIATRGRGVW